MATTEHITSAEQLARSHDLGRCELVRGELVMMSPTGEEHGWIAAILTGHLMAWVRPRDLGRVYGAEAGFVIGHDPDTVRAPDVSFVRAERLGSTPSKGFLQGPPDLAVEVVSPNDRAGEVLAKVHQWLDVGCRAVWLVDPESRMVTVYRSRTQIVALALSDQLTGEDLLPGFSLPVAEIFKP